MISSVIDLGTNTFHLLIARTHPDTDRIEEVYRERRFVKLASEGITTIGPAPFARGIDTLKAYRKKLDEYGVDTVVAIGTAALRTASNGEVFVRTAELEAGIGIRLIDGDREADYITRGVLAALPPLTGRVMIMDIGGGSTEFILASGEGVHWRRSFPLGSMVLARGFHHADPIGEEEIRAIHTFLNRELAPLADALIEYPAPHLVGAAGAFEALAGMLSATTAPEYPHAHDLPLEGLERLHFELLASTMAERLARPDLPDERAELIVVASILLRYVMDMAGTERVSVSDYALKEGVLFTSPDRIAR